MRANIGLKDTVMLMWEGRTRLRRLLVPRVHQCPISALGGTRTDIRQGGGRESESGATQRSGADIRAAVAGGSRKNATKSKHGDDDDDGGKGVRDRGQQGDQRGSTRVRSDGGGTKDQRGLLILGLIQRWREPQWGIQYNKAWQACWKTLGIMTTRRYDAPSGRFGCHLVHALAAELPGVRQRRWYAERFIVFQTATLQRAQHINKPCEIRKCIYQMLDA